MNVKEQLQKIRHGGSEAHEAALALGLLLERRRRADDMTAEIAQICGPDLASTHLTDEEAEEAVRGLLQIAGQPEYPHPMAIWALTKSADPRMIAPLAGLLRRTAADADHLDLAYQALVGLTLFDTPESRSAIDLAGSDGHGEVKATAQQYLSVRGNQS